MHFRGGSGPDRTRAPPRVCAVLLREEFFRECRSVDAKMRGDIGEDARQCPETQIIVVGDRDVVLAASLCRQPHVAARLARDGVLVATQGAREVAAGEITRESHASRGDHFVMDEMEPDDARPFGLVEVAADRIADRLP